MMHFQRSPYLNVFIFISLISLIDSFIVKPQLTAGLAAKSFSLPIRSKNDAHRLLSSSSTILVTKMKDSDNSEEDNEIRNSVNDQNSNNDNNNEEEEEEGKESGFPCLPPIGASSFNGDEVVVDDHHAKAKNKNGTPVGFVGSPKFELQYTCKVCDTRNSHKVSRLAYRQGVVIAVCKGCMSKHLIADNLGWSKYIGGFDGDTNIEAFMETIGRGDEVNRVSKDVFDLEKSLYDGPKSISGKIVDDGTNGSAFE